MEHEQQEQIAHIAETGGVRSLVELLPFLPPAAHPLGSHAASAVGAVLARSTNAQLAWFDQWCRSWRPKGPPAPAWTDIQLGQVDWPAQFRGVTALASFHQNGFVREIAVRLLGEFDDGFELPFLLLRTTDWVPQVRTNAVATLAKRVTPGYARYWLDALALIGRLEASRRDSKHHADATCLVRDVEQLLVRTDVRPLLEAALSGGSLATRRGALRLVLMLPPPERRAMLLDSLLDADPSIAIGAAKRLFQDARAEDVISLVDKTLAHPLARVRLIALEAAHRHDVPAATVAMDRAVFDEARSIRAWARYESSKRTITPPDFASAYRRGIREHDGRARVVALEGLAEVGTTDDVCVFHDFLNHPNARMRAAAIVGIGRCDGSNHLDELAAALDDHSLVVRRAAAQYGRLYLGRGAVRRMRASRAR